MPESTSIWKTRYHSQKAMIAHHGFELSNLQSDNYVTIQFEAAVAGGIPAIKVLREV